MWEFSICFDEEKKSLNFANKIMSFVKNLKGIVVCVYTQNYYKVLIAVPKLQKEKTKKFILEKLAEYILLTTKKDYILSHLNFQKNTSTNMKVFLEALVCFDSEVDKNILINTLKFDKNLIVKSFIDFKLQFLKEKWNDLVTLANDNFIYILNDESFLELIKFLISNLEYRLSTVNIFSKKDCYLLLDTNLKKIDDFLIDKNIIYDDQKLITSLIALNPEKIIVHCNNFLKEPLLKNLYNFFSNRIEIYY